MNRQKKSTHASFLTLGCILSLAALLITLNMQPRRSPGSSQITAVMEEIRGAFPNVPTITPHELNRMLEEKQTLRLIDVRTGDEFYMSHLRGAQLPALLEEITAETSPTKTVLYCSVGWRSAIMADSMIESGVHNVFNLAGGIFYWTQLGYPIYREGKETNQVHPYNATWSDLLPEQFHPKTFSPIEES